ncbi:single-stranded-DNA-specific exonuclease [Ruminococcaceae bacterium YAD3003]|nr:single-stranded-DNA-specific exonuclease [Ruminococcaceae bacterium YAD3003]
MLLTGKTWRLSASRKVEDADALLGVLLKNRGIAEGQDEEQFLSEEDGIWHDPFLYKDMREAVNLINETIDNHGRILVYGDYDCDGVTATSILVRYFRSHQADVEYIVPHRSEHGYGLTEKIMDKVIAHNPELVITVDCGVTNVDTVQELKHRGIKVIVTDHHNVKDELPPADCVICAKRPDNTYPFIDLCGAGVALKLVEALGKDGTHKVTGNIWRQAVELAGIATIADLVSVTNENRTIIKRAFKSMKNPSNVGVGVMNEMLLAPGKTLDETFISFNFVPRINAAGRLYDSADALKLFLENNPTEAKTAAQDLTRENDERKEIEAKVFDEARAQLENPARPDKWSLTNTCGPIVVYGKDWHQGVLGIVAGKLSQFYGRSALVFTDDATEPGCAKGSGRAYGDFDLYDCLTRISDYLVNFGGHKKAAGMLVRKTEMGAFMEALEKESAKIFEEKGQSGEADEDNVINAECEIMPEGLSFESYRQVSKLRPFGIGNPKPIFVTNGLIISGIAQMSNGAHIRLDLTDSKGEANLSAVGFGMGDYYNILRAGDTIDIAYTINEYCYRGETSLSLHLEDIRPRYEEGFMWQKADIAEKLYTSGLAMNQIAKMAPGENIESEMKPTSEQFGACYKAIEKFGGTAMSTVDIDLLARLVSNNYDVACTPFQVKRCLEVFADCNLIRLRSVTPMTVCFNILKTGDKVKLSDSEVYRRIIGD